MKRRLDILLLTLFLPLAALAEDSLQGEVRFRAAADGTVWVGQQQELHLELWSTGFRFGDQQFQLPEVEGGYLLQADASTLKLSEVRSGETWQGLRYSLLLYPQRAGSVEVPGFDVSFETAGGFGRFLFIAVFFQWGSKCYGSYQVVVQQGECHRRGICRVLDLTHRNIC